MNDITEQRIMTEAFAPSADSELHKIPVLNDEEELIEMSMDFNLEEFQVVRREFFAHIREPAVTFNNRKFYVNSACLTKFPHTDYVQALINPHTKILALRPCGENERGSFQWCSIGQDKRKPRQTTCTLFFLKMFDMMDWNPDHRYKMLGNIIRANGEYLIAFDLTSTEVYQHTYDSRFGGVLRFEDICQESAGAHLCCIHFGGYLLQIRIPGSQPCSSPDHRHMGGRLKFFLRQHYECSYQALRGV